MASGIRCLRVLVPIGGIAIIPFQGPTLTVGDSSSPGSWSVPGIEARPVWKPMHLQPVFHGCEVVGGGVTAALFRDGLCLPSGSNAFTSTLRHFDPSTGSGQRRLRTAQAQYKRQAQHKSERGRPVPGGGRGAPPGSLTSSPLSVPVAPGHLRWPGAFWLGSARFRVGDLTISGLAGRCWPILGIRRFCPQLASTLGRIN